MAYWLKMWWLIGWRCGGSLVKDVVAHWLKMRWLIGWRCGGSLIKDVVAHCLKMWWLIGGDVVAQTSGAGIPDSNPASSTMILMRCRIIV